MARGAQYRTAGETAALLGVSIKALRVYEAHGLVMPDRSAAGYRVYGPEQLRRLHQVLALKSLGLPLARIHDCLTGLGDQLGPILEVQERDLRERAKGLETAIAALVAARRRLEAGHDLSVDDLATLTKETTMTEASANWRENFDRLFARHFDGPERQTLATGPADTEADQRARNALLAEATALLGTDPGAPAALDLARRWRDRAVHFTGGNPALLLKLRAAMDEALARPDIAQTLPWRAEMAFIKAATEALEAAGR